MFIICIIAINRYVAVRDHAVVHSKQVGIGGSETNYTAPKRSVGVAIGLYAGIVDMLSSEAGEILGRSCVYRYLGVGAIGKSVVGAVLQHPTGGLAVFGPAQGGYGAIAWGECGCQIRRSGASLLYATKDDLVLRGQYKSSECVSAIMAIRG